MTHLTMWAWAGLVGAPWRNVVMLPPDSCVCTGQYWSNMPDMTAENLIPSHCADYEFPTCPECAVYADAAREMGAAS